MIERLFLRLLALDSGATIGAWDASSGLWRVNLAEKYSRTIYGITIAEALERAITSVKTAALEAALFPATQKE